MDNFQTEYKKQFEIAKQFYDKAIRNIFKGEIKGNFLIRILYKVLDKLKPELSKYYPPINTMEGVVVGDTDNFGFDICKYIIGLHKSNMIFVPEIQQKNLMDNAEYEQKLVGEVLENIKLRFYGGSYFRQKQIMSGDRFLYFHLPYDLFIISIRTNELLTNNKSDDIPNYSIFSKISDMSLSALSLLENNFLDNTYSICRGIIELTLIYFAISKNKNAIKMYNNLVSIESNSSRCGLNYPQKFLDLFENRINKTERKQTNYLHFGWVDNIKNYHKIVDRNPYSITGLLKYLRSEYEDIDFDLYERFYKQCHSYTHANIITCKYPLLSYFEISIMLYITIIPIYSNLCEILKTEPIVNNIDMLQKSEKDFKMIIEQYNKRNTQNFEKYYNNKNCL